MSTNKEEIIRDCESAIRRKKQRILGRELSSKKCKRVNDRVKK